MNHPHEQQAAAMARAGELTDGEQLRECINSGQVAAAQVVAHAEAGDATGWPPGMLQDDSRQLSKALSRDPNARALVREAVTHQETAAEELVGNLRIASIQIAAAGHAGWGNTCTDAANEIERLTAALAAERAEVALHEHVTIEEALEALMQFDTGKEYMRFGRMKDALESFLQGRAKPAQEEITDAAFAAAVQHCEVHGIVEITPESLEDIVSVVIRASKGEKT